MADTMGRYLSQVATFLAPRSVEAAEAALRQLAAGWSTTPLSVPSPLSAATTSRTSRCGSLPARRARPPASTTQRQRLRTLRAFFERIIEWDWSDAPLRNPILGGDLPPRPESLPRFLDDHDAARLMAAAHAAVDPRDRLVVELLARTGIRASELCGLDADAVAVIGDGHWLRIPVGKLRNDRYVPLHPDLVTLLGDWTAANLDHIRHHRRGSRPSVNMFWLSG